MLGIVWLVLKLCKRAPHGFFYDLEGIIISPDGAQIFSLFGNDLAGGVQKIVSHLGILARYASNRVFGPYA
jgi:hypothetical protein